MTWRLARSLEVLRDQINTAAPGRSKASDGGIGDAAHASRASDHNPWIKDGAQGVVTAIDITHDPAAGVDCAAIAEVLKAGGDARIKYVIWNRRIWNPEIESGWRPYNGTNPHDKHVHVSVKPAKAHYDDPRPWQWQRPAPALAIDGARIGNQGPLIVAYQDRLQSLGYAVGRIDGVYGSRMRAAVLAFQAENRLVTSGDIDAATRVALNSAEARRMPVGDRAAETEEDLAKAGSGTIVDARQAKQVAVGLTATGAAKGLEENFGIIGTAQDWVSQVSLLRGIVEPGLILVRWALSYWWVFVIVAGVLIIRKTDAIKRARVIAHRLGLHLGR